MQLLHIHMTTMRVRIRFNYILPVIESMFGLSFLITQFSVSITHNSKMVGPIAKSLFGKQ